MESNKPRILIFTDWYLPGYKAGGPIKSCVNLVALLHSRFEFFVVCSDRDYLEQRPYPNTEPGAFRPVGEAQVCYLSPEEENYRQIADLIKALSPDRVYINGLFSRTYSIFPLLAAKRLKKRVIVSPRGMLAPGALAIKSLKKKVFLSGISMLGGYRNVEFHATDATEEDGK